MNFDNFDGIDIVDKTSLLRNCKSAERNIMISPYNAIANSRAALEILCKGLIKKNNLIKLFFILMSKKFLKTILRVFSKNFELVKH